MSAASPYVAYARALDALGWSPVEFRVAESFGERLSGMIRLPPLAPNGLPYVLAFPDCPSVHTCAMAYPLDIAFIDRAGHVLQLHEGVAPWHFKSCPEAWATLERASAIEEVPRRCGAYAG